VMACGPVLKTVARQAPLRMYSHSSALGCQCISRRPPGLIVTIAAATVLDTRKLVGSVANSPSHVYRRPYGSGSNVGAPKSKLRGKALR
jgi:hypothetical protein